MSHSTLNLGAYDSLDSSLSSSGLSEHSKQPSCSHFQIGSKKELVAGCELGLGVIMNGKHEDTKGVEPCSVE